MPSHRRGNTCPFGNPLEKGGASLFSSPLCVLILVNDYRVVNPRPGKRAPAVVGGVGFMGSPYLLTAQWEMRSGATWALHYDEEREVMKVVTPAWAP